MVRKLSVASLVCNIINHCHFVVVQDGMCVSSRLADTSLDDFPLPNVTQFMDIRVAPSSQRLVEQRDSATVLPRNQLYYEYAQHHVNRLVSQR